MNKLQSLTDSSRFQNGQDYKIGTKEDINEKNKNKYLIMPGVSFGAATNTSSANLLRQHN